MVFSAADEKAYFWVAWRDNVTERMLGVQRDYTTRVASMGAPKDLQMVE